MFYWLILYTGEDDILTYLLPFDELSKNNVINWMIARPSPKW